MSEARNDRIMPLWLGKQYEEGMALAEQSDIVSLVPVAGDPPYRYCAEFRCRGLIRSNGEILPADHHAVGITFLPDHLRTVGSPGRVLTWLAPVEAWHPNVRASFVCVGHIAPGTSLVSLLFQLYQIITWQRFTPREDDALNAEACSWARRNLERFPIDPRRSLLRSSEPADG